MALVARWNAKWDLLDAEDAEQGSAAADLDPFTQKVLELFPADVAASIRHEQSASKRAGLLALNCYIIEVNGPPKETPLTQRPLLEAISDALLGLQAAREEEATEVLLERLFATLRHSRVHPQHVEHAVGAAALLPADKQPARLLDCILRACLERARDFSARCLAHVCWAAATLRASPLTTAVLRAVVHLAPGKAAELLEADVAVFAWACATSRPQGARKALREILKLARLPSPGSEEGNIVAWAAECFGLDASAYFGVPPSTAPAALSGALHLHLQSIGCKGSAEVLHVGGPAVYQVHDFLVSEEAQLFAELADERSRASTTGDASDMTGDFVLESPAGAAVPMIARLRRRVAKLLDLPESNCEPVRAIRSGVAGEDTVDFFSGEPGVHGPLYLGGQRVASVVVFLRSGARILFPRAGCNLAAEMHSALIWLNVRTDGHVDEDAMYREVCPDGDGGTVYALKLCFRAGRITQAQGLVQQVDTGRRGRARIPPAQDLLTAPDASAARATGSATKAMVPPIRSEATFMGQVAHEYRPESEPTGLEGFVVSGGFVAADGPSREQESKLAQLAGLVAACRLPVSAPPPPCVPEADCVYEPVVDFDDIEGGAGGRDVSSRDPFHAAERALQAAAAAPSPQLRGAAGAARVVACQPDASSELQLEASKAVRSLPTCVEDFEEVD